MERAGRLISKLKLPAGTVRPDQIAIAGWAAAVGPKIAAHAEAVWYEKKRLVVEVGDAVWQQQLWVLRGQILQSLEKLFGERLVEQIDFRLRPRRRMPQRALEAHPSQDEAERIHDPVLRTLYKEQRRRRSA